MRSFNSLQLKQVKQGLRYTLLNFATPIAFYLMFQWKGAKPAIGLAVLVTLIQVLVHGIQRLKFSPLFILASGFTVGFGTIDLFLSSPRFFRLEPCVQNLMVGSLFLLSFFTRVSFVAKLVEALPKWMQPEKSPSMDQYLRKLTLVWVVYLYAKAALFLYLALTVNLGELIVLRSLIGSGSLVLMFAGEFLYRKYWRKRYFPRA